MSHKFVAYGQILDEFVIGNLWRMTANQFPADFKIRNISVFLQSSLAGMRRGGRSRLSFHIDSGQISDVSPWIQSTLKYFDRSPHADVAYCHPESQLVSYSYRLAGDFIEEKLMDKLADNLEDISVDMEDVLIHYSSLLFSRDHAMPSIADFKLVGPENEVNRARRAIADFANKIHPIKREDATVPRVFEIRSDLENVLDIRISAHVLDTDLMRDLAGIVKDPNVDLRDVKITYPSSMFCRNAKENSLLSFTLYSPIGSDVPTRMQDLCREQRQSKLLSIIPAKRLSEFDCIITGEARERQILDSLSELIFDDVRSNDPHGVCKVLDITNITVKYDSLSHFSSYPYPFELYCTFKYDSEQCTDFIEEVIQIVREQHKCRVIILPQHNHS